MKYRLYVLIGGRFMFVESYGSYECVEAVRVHLFEAGYVSLVFDN